MGSQAANISRGARIGCNTYLMLLSSRVPPAVWLILQPPLYTAHVHSCILTRTTYGEGIKVLHCTWRHWGPTDWCFGKESAALGWGIAQVIIPVPLPWRHKEHRILSTRNLPHCKGGFFLIPGDRKYLLLPSSQLTFNFNFMHHGRNTLCKTASYGFAACSFELKQ